MDRASTAAIRIESSCVPVDEGIGREPGMLGSSTGIDLINVPLTPGS